MDQNADLLRRIARLERENRRIKLGVGLAAALGLILLAAGSALPRASEPAPVQGKTLEVEKLVIKGADGKEAVSLGLDPQGAPLLLLRKDKATALLTVASPGLLLRGDDGRRGAFLGIDPRGVTKLDLSSEKLVDGVRLSVQADGSAGAYVLNNQGRERASMEWLSTGASQVTARDDRGVVRGFFGLDPTGNSSALLLDAAGRRRIGAVVQQDGAPLLEL